MSRCRCFVRGAACLAAALSVFAFQPVGVVGAEETAAERQARLIAVLESPDAPRAEKAITCKHLARFGDGEAVPALAALLTDEQLAAWARIALEAIPDAAADRALREAATELEGMLLVGVINSIGMRGDAAAVEILAEKLSDADAEVAAASAVALGRIGNGEAAGVLGEFLNGEGMASAPEEVRSAVAEGCILCAEEYDRSGDAAAAIELFDAVRAADLPRQRLLEATRGAILARKADGLPQLLELLESDDREWFGLGLWVARELPGQEATDALVAELAAMTPQRQALLLLALIDREELPPVSVLAQSAETGPKNVRMAAIQAIRRQGDASCVPALLAAVAEDDEEISEAALIALEDLPGAEVDADLTSRLTTADIPTRVLLIELAGRRRIEAAVPELLEAADDRNGAVRAAALVALGETVDFASLPLLIERTVRARSAEELAAVGDALVAASGRMPDRDACASLLAAAMADAATPAKAKLLEALGAVGGEGALAAIVEASRSPDASVQGAAAQQLGEWMTPDAAPALLHMARNAADDRLKIRALRGYLRIARQFVVSDADRLAMFHSAMGAALRDEERRLALDVLIRIPSVQTLELATRHLNNAALRDAAAGAAVNIAGRLAEDQPKAVAAAMQRVLGAGIGDEGVRNRAEELRDEARAAAR